MTDHSATTEWDARLPSLTVTARNHYFSSSCHEAAYHGLGIALGQRTGLVVLTGEPGVGKTLLLYRFMVMAPEATRFVFCPTGGLDFDQWLAFVCEHLQIAMLSSERVRRLKAIKAYAEDCHARGQTPVLIIDDAHRLSPETLSHLLTLTRPGQGRPLLQLVLSGQPDLREHLRGQRIAHPYLADALLVQLGRLDPTEAKVYLDSRLRLVPEAEGIAVGTDVRALMATLSQGAPGRIDALLDRALAYCRTVDQAVLTNEMVEQAAFDWQRLHGGVADPDAVAEQDAPARRWPRRALAVAALAALGVIATQGDWLDWRARSGSMPMNRIATEVSSLAAPDEAPAVRADIPAMSRIATEVSSLAAPDATPVASVAAEAATGRADIPAFSNDALDSQAIQSPPTVELAMASSAEASGNERAAKPRADRPGQSVTVTRRVSRAVKPPPAKRSGSARASVAVVAVAPANNRGRVPRWMQGFDARMQSFGSRIDRALGIRSYNIASSELNGYRQR